jgi:hypothetical protein
MNNRFKKWMSIKRHQNARGLLLIAIVLFNLGLWFISSLLAFFIAPDQYGNIVRALWESGITWMLEPGFYDPSVAPAIRIISIIVILISMITFTGGIIGYVGNLFSSIIDNAKRGKSNLYIYDHILILNWNYKALELIADYRYDDETTSVVILSNHDKEEIEDAITRKLYESKDGLKKKLDIIVRNGEVFSKADLMAVCVEDAKSIIILSDESSQHPEARKDMLAMKTLMLVSNMDLKRDQTILVEVKEQASILMIKNYIAKNTKREHQILPMLPDELMGRLIAQTLLMPELNKVYHELLSFDGAEFYTVKDIDALSFIESHNKAIPIYNHKDYLYVLSDNQSSILDRRATPLSQYQKIEIKDLSRYHEKHIVIFGKNQKLEYILDSIKLYEKENHTTIKTTLIDSNGACVISQTTDAIEKIDHILILSADHLDPEDYDSDVLVTLLMTQEIAKKHQAEIIIELLDPKHFDIAQSYNVKNTIISNEYISHLMTQLSKNRHLYDLFMDLLTYDEEGSLEETYEVYAYPAQDILNTSFPLTFASKAELIYSIYMSGHQSYICLGTIKDGNLDIFKGDLDHQESLVIRESDILVMICK